MSDRLKTPILPLVQRATPRAEPPTVPRSRPNANATVRTMPVALPAPADRAVLTVIHGVNAGQVFSIESDSAIVGRYEDADFVIDDPAISRTHCRFRITDERVFVEDLGSANGTFVHTQRLRESQLCELFSGDRVQVGPNVMLRFSLSDRAEEEMQRRLYASATRDALTGVYSRAYLTERLAIELAYAKRHKTELSLMILAIDKYAETSARIGGPATAKMVRALATRLEDTVRVDDVLGRFGGDRFAVVVRAANTLGASVISEALRVAVEEIAPVSVGVASLGELTGDRDLVALAEARLAEAVRDGGNRTQATTPAK